MLQSGKFGTENDLFSYEYQTRVKFLLSTAQQNVYNQSLENCQNIKCWNLLHLASFLHCEGKQRIFLGL